MSAKIVPTLFSKFKEDLYSQYNTLSNYFSYFHIDVSSIDFVDFDFYDTQIFEMLDLNNHFCEVHLMCRSVENYIKELSQFKCIKSIIIHFEIFKSREEIEYFKENIMNTYPSISFQLALSPHTLVEDVFMYLSMFKQVMIMGVIPGSQGQEFVPIQFKKAQIISKMGLQVSMDGGVNAKTLDLLLSTQKIHQLNIGSYLNLAKDKNALEENISNINSLILKYEKEDLDLMHKDPVIAIADVGGTHVRVYRGLYSEFSIETIEQRDTSLFKSSKEIMNFIVKPLNPEFIIFGVAGPKEFDKISMTHDEIKFRREDIEKMFPKSQVELYNDLELAGYGVQSQNNIKFDDIKSDTSNDSLSNSYLEILIIIGTGLGITHISNSSVAYNSQGGHIYPRIDDIEFLNFLENELNTNTITFDDILSARGLEFRYMYDTNIFKSSYEIIELAKQKDSTVMKTMNFILQELLYFLQDCIYFDNITTKLYLGGEFSVDIYHLLQIYKSKELEELELKCEIETISNNHLQFLGGLELIRRRIRNK